MNKVIVLFLVLNLSYYGYLLKKVDNSSKVLDYNIEQLSNIIEQSHKNGCLIGTQEPEVNCDDKAKEHKDDLMEIINNEQ